MRGTAKRSLQDLSRAINGDARSEPQPLFKVSVVLDKGTQKIELSPTIITLTQMVNVISKKLLMVLKKIERLFHPQKSRLGYNERQKQLLADAEKLKEEAGDEEEEGNGETAQEEDTAKETEEQNKVVVVTSPKMDKMKSFYGKYKSEWRACISTVVDISMTSSLLQTCFIIIASYLLNFKSPKSSFFNTINIFGLLFTHTLFSYY